MKIFRIIVFLVLAAFAAGVTVTAMAQSEPIGVVVMHGKGGSPQRLVIDLAKGLEAKGFLVANLEMPWSGRRNYDVSTDKAEEEVAAALAGLKAKGAKKVFVIGHSQGGAFAVHLAGKLPADGYVLITPGGDVTTRVFVQNVGASLDRARKLVADGKGNEPTVLEDFEGSRGTYQVMAVPAAYVTWFDPAGAMNMGRALQALGPGTPILWVAPTRDYPALMKMAPSQYRSLPKNPLTKVYEPDADHRTAPAASVEEIARWTREVAGQK